MVIGFDSATPPTTAQADAAKAAGIRVWSGYLATKPNVHLYRPWTQTEFENARRCGGTPIAFCSGADDPVACKDRAFAWNVRLCLDVENGIRPDGPWVQGFLDTAGCGLYGQHYRDAFGNWQSVHLNRKAAFHIMSWYITVDPAATWLGPQSADGVACGWQWYNTHSEFGIGVDRSWLDDWFFQEGDDFLSALTPEEQRSMYDAIFNPVPHRGTVPGVTGAGLLDQIHQELGTTIDNPVKTILDAMNKKLDDLKTEVDTLKNATPAAPTANKSVTGTFTGTMS